MESQTKMIKAHLEKGGSLTAIEALMEFKCFRLAARIKDLRDRGYPIESQTITLENGKRVANYYMGNRNGN